VVLLLTFSVFLFLSAGLFSGAEYDQVTTGSRLPCPLQQHIYASPPLPSLVVFPLFSPTAAFLNYVVRLCFDGVGPSRCVGTYLDNAGLPFLATFFFR
jgi:hypothetical protein